MGGEVLSCEGRSHSAILHADFDAHGAGDGFRVFEEASDHVAESETEGVEHEGSESELAEVRGNFRRASGDNAAGDERECEDGDGWAAGSDSVCEVGRPPADEYAEDDGGDGELQRGEAHSPGVDWDILSGQF